MHRILYLNLLLIIGLSSPFNGVVYALAAVKKDTVADQIMTEKHTMPSVAQQLSTKEKKSIASTVINYETVRQAIFDALQVYDADIKYWQKQRDHMNWYWVQRSPRYWDQDVEKELSTKLAYLEGHQKKYFELLAQLERFDVENCAYHEQNTAQPTPDIIEFCKEIPFVAEALKNLDIKARAYKQETKIKIIIANHQQWIRASMGVYVRPGHIERNWQKYCALAVLAGVAFYKKDRIHAWGVDLHKTTMEKYVNPLKDEVFGAFHIPQLIGKDKNVKGSNENVAPANSNAAVAQKLQLNPIQKWWLAKMGLEETVNDFIHMINDLYRKGDGQLEQTAPLIESLKKLLQANSLTFAAIAAVPIVAAGGATTYFVGKQARNVYKKLYCCDYEVVRDAYTQIRRILNKSSNMMLLIDQGKMLYYIHMLKYQAQYMKYSDRVEFLSDVHELGKCDHESSVDSKLNTLKIMYDRYAFLKPEYVD